MMTGDIEMLRINRADKFRFHMNMKEQIQEVSLNRRYSFDRAQLFLVMLAIVSLMGLDTVFVRAQNVTLLNPQIRTQIQGLPPGAAANGTAEKIDLATGKLYMYIPVTSLPQPSGWSLPLGFTYSSNTWKPVTNLTAVSNLYTENPNYWTSYFSYDYNFDIRPIDESATPILGPNIPKLQASSEYMGSWPDPGDPNNMYQTQSPIYCMTHWFFTDLAGNSHAFDRPDNPICTDTMSNTWNQVYHHLPAVDNSGFSLEIPNLVADGTGWQHYVDGAYVVGPDGTVYTFAPPNRNIGGTSQQGSYVSLVSRITSRRGEQINFVQTTPDIMEITDSVGRKVTFGQQPNNAGYGYSYRDSSGATRMAVFTQSGSIPTINGSTLPNNSPRALPEFACSVNPSTEPPPQTQVTMSQNYPWWNQAALSLTPLTLTFDATGRSYLFILDQEERLVYVRYPTGGYSRYEYSLNEAGDGTCMWAESEVSKKYECSDSSGACSHEDTTTYDYVWAPYGPLRTNGKVTITDSAKKIVHTLDPTTYQFQVLETDSELSDTSGHILSQTHTDYSSQYVPFPIRQTERTLDGAGNVVSSYKEELAYDQVYMDAPQQSMLVTLEQTTSQSYFSSQGSSTPVRSETQSWNHFGHTYNLLSSHTVQGFDGMSATENYDWDGSGNLTQFRKSGTAASEVAIQYQNIDQFGRPHTVIDPRGGSNSLEYTNRLEDNVCAVGADSSSFPTKTTDALGHQNISTIYSCSGLLASTTDPNNQKTTYSWDYLGRAVGRTYPDSSAETVSYGNDAIPLTKTTTHAAISIAEVFDGFGRSKQNIGSDGATTETEYDALGRVSRQSIRHFSSSSPAYIVWQRDALDREVSRTDVDNSVQYWCYNGVATMGQPGCRGKAGTEAGSGTEWVDVLDASSRWRQEVYDPFENLVEVVEPDANGNSGAKTLYQYDGLKNLQTVTQSGVGSDGQRSRAFQHDGFGRLLTSSNPETGTICYGVWNNGSCVNGYDSNGNLQYKTDARGVTASYSYDLLNRLVSKVFSNDTANTPSICYQYDVSSIGYPNANLVGRLTNQWTQSGACSSSLPSNGIKTRRSIRAYDAMGRVRVEERCVMSNCTNSSTPFSLHYSYDLAGNLTDYDNGVRNLTLSRTYDSAGRLNKISSSVYDATHPNSLYSVGSFLPNGSPGVFDIGLHLNVTQHIDSRLRPVDLNVVEK